VQDKNLNEGEEKTRLFHTVLKTAEVGGTARRIRKGEKEKGAWQKELSLRGSPEKVVMGSFPGGASGGES